MFLKSIVFSSSYFTYMCIYSSGVGLRWANAFIVYLFLNCRGWSLVLYPSVFCEKELEDVDDDLDFDEDDMEDYGTSASGDGVGPPSPSTPPSGAGERGNAGGGGSDAGDDLLGM